MPASSAPRAAAPQAEPRACAQCPLRAVPLFIPHTPDELALVEQLKRREVDVDAHHSLVHEGQTHEAIYTLLCGWAYRYKTLSDGRRQILNFLLPGDFIGAQQHMQAPSPHGVRTLTPARLCVFEHDALWRIHTEAPSLGYKVTWLVAHEESLVDENLLSNGRRSAEERVATLLIVLYKRAMALTPKAKPSEGVAFPLTQSHIADALGLSLAHTNKTLRKLELRRLFRIQQERLYLVDAAQLGDLADVYGDGQPRPRPLV